MKKTVNICRLIFLNLVFFQGLQCMESMSISQQQPPKRSWFKRYCCCCCSGDSSEEYRVAPALEAEDSVETVAVANSNAGRAPVIVVSKVVDPAPLPGAVVEEIAPVRATVHQFLTATHPVMVAPGVREGVALTDAPVVAPTSGGQLGDVRYRGDFALYAGETRLHDAILRKEEDRVKEILGSEELKNIFLNSRDLLGRTPLHVAVLMRNFPLVQALVALGAKVNICDDDKRTVLHYAVDDCNEDMVDFLLRSTAIDITVRDCWGVLAEELDRSGALMRRFFDGYRARARVAQEGRLQ